MTPAEEDALIERAWKENDSMYESDCMTPLLRSAIRAAVAAERERCAKVCDSRRDDWHLLAVDAFGDRYTRLLEAATEASDCAAAIREGEK